MSLFCILPALSLVDSWPLQSSLHDTVGNKLEAVARSMCNTFTIACIEAAGKMVKIQTTAENPLTIPDLYMTPESIYAYISAGFLPFVLVY